MDEFMMYTIYVEGFNALLSVALLYIYAQNYRALKSSVGMGLMIFSFVLFLQNAGGILLHFTSGEVYTTMVATQVFALKLIEGIALIALAYSAWKE
ncbi:MAG: hypothetical protein IPJ89_02315 [Candidatus Iainarchaeum archaeon]|uniref:Uncharacterized protein n=1 Tax=Candidatus Iainarchaeum sp. TaxID=3101447 RepID=A0A7T9I257_9ARCH|nr:MAG: hypothetical protein IPJ89_02315 [Candidatus Diapherotrites archaeon]